MNCSGEAVPPPPFSEIYGSYYTRIVRYLARLLGPDEAEDIAQDVFLKASRSLPEFRGESSLVTWLYRIATNAAVDRLRSAEHHAAVRSEPVDVTVASLTSVERATIRREMSDCVQGLVNELPEEFRQVLILSEMEGWRNREIAEILGVSEAAVKIRLHRARARLRLRLQAKCSFSHNSDSVLVCDNKSTPSPQKGS